MKKEMVYVIICLSIIASLLLGIGLIIKQNKSNDEENKKEPATPYMITLKDSPGFEISPVLYNGDNELALFITSFEAHYSIDVELTFLDSGKQVIGTNTVNVAYVPIQKQVLLSVPVDKNSVEFVEVRIKLAKSDDVGEVSLSDIILDSNQLKFDIDDKIDDNNNATITLNAVNPYNQDIQLINGYVLLYDSDKLVDAISYSAIDITKGGEISAKVNTILHDTTGVFKYDKIKVIVNELF